jgi:hypothetical protein
MRKKPRKLGKMKKLLKEKFTTISTSVKVLLVTPSKIFGPLPLAYQPQVRPQTRKVLRPKPSPILRAPTYLPTYGHQVPHLLTTYLHSNFLQFLMMFIESFLWSTICLGILSS